MRARWRRAAVPLILLSAGITGCSSGGSSGGSSAAPAAAAATTTVAAAPATTAAPAATASSGNAVPQYQPATVTSSEHVLGVSKTVLTSPDPVGKVAAFYGSALSSGGWRVEKTDKSGSTVGYKALKGAAAAEVEISPAGTGASITVKVVG